MSTLEKIKSHCASFCDASDVTVTQSHEANDCNEYEIFDENMIKLCYIIEFFENPITNEKLESVVFEIYSENENTTSNYEDDDFLCSTVCDNFDELIDEISDII